MAKWDQFDLDTEIDDSAPFVDADIEFRRRPIKIPLFFAFAASVFGIVLASQSTADFVAHLDREVHAMHCSVVPGGAAEIGESGCRTVMLSPYSSWFRDQYWGGIPIALWAIAVFAFMAYRSGHLLLKKSPRKGEIAFVFVASFLPGLMSAIYGYIAHHEVGAMCTVCVGIYVVSMILFVALLAAVLMASSDGELSGGHGRRFAVGIAEGVCFVLAMTLVYVGTIPEVSATNTRIRGAAGCGQLAQTEDPAGIMIDLETTASGIPSIEVLDPLCPACRAFDERLKASGLAARLSQRAVLFPLDSACNWMVTTSLHPGACSVSEAMLCAPSKAQTILRWAFANQEKLLEMGKTDPKGLTAKLNETFPSVRGCLGSAKVKNRMVKSLRWAVANALPVMTPQLFVAGKRLCDEDTDLGLEYTLTKMLGDRK